MEKLSFGEEWEKEEPKREAYLKYLKEHPLSLEEIDEQFKRNREIRFKNLKSKQEKEKNKNDL